MRGLWPAFTAGKPSATKLRARVYSHACQRSGLCVQRRSSAVWQTVSVPSPAEGLQLKRSLATASSLSAAFSIFTPYLTPFPTPYLTPYPTVLPMAPA